MAWAWGCCSVALVSVLVLVLVLLVLVLLVLVLLQLLLLPLLYTVQSRLICSSRRISLQSRRIVPPDVEKYGRWREAGRGDVDDHSLIL